MAPIIRIVGEIQLVLHVCVDKIGQLTQLRVQLLIVITSKIKNKACLRAFRL